MSAANQPAPHETYHLSPKERLARGLGSVACAVTAYVLRDKLDLQSLNLADVVEGATAVTGISLAAESLTGRLISGMVAGDHSETDR